MDDATVADVEVVDTDECRRLQEEEILAMQVCLCFDWRHVSNYRLFIQRRSKSRLPRKEPLKGRLS